MFLSDVEGLSVEPNFRKSKWLFFGTYHPPAQNDQYFFNCIDKALDTYSNYNNVLLAGGFNAEDDGPSLSTFLYQHISIMLLRQALVLKNSSEPTSTDLFLITKNTNFQNTVVVCSGLSDFHISSNGIKNII